MRSRQVLDELFDRCYHDLCVMAASQARWERSGHDVEPEAIVHEAYLLLRSQGPWQWNDQTHFVAVVAGRLRQILVAEARWRCRLKRGGGRRRVPVEDHLLAMSDDPNDRSDLHELVQRLCALHERRGRVVELRFLRGLSVEQVADLLGVAPRTVECDWSIARVWLRDRL